MDKSKFENILEYLKNAIAGSEFENHVYAVGGSIRDLLMGNEIKDIDLAVTIENGGIQLADYLFEKRLLIDPPVTFERYGTCMFKLKEFPEDELEAVQTRKEKYTDYNSRNPETAFGTLEDDAKRRDLTINALYKNVSTGEIVDLFKGQADMNKKVLRTTSEPDFVFEDDPLRILRVIRFASRFGWKIEKETLKSMKKNAYRLNIISRERIAEEFKKILNGNNKRIGLTYLAKTGAMKEAFNLTKFDKYCAEEIALHTFGSYEISDELLYAFNLAAFYIVYTSSIWHETTKYEMNIMIELLKLDNKTRKLFEKFLKYARMIAEFIHEENRDKNRIKYEIRKHMFEIRDFEIHKASTQLAITNFGAVGLHTLSEDVVDYYYNTLLKIINNNEFSYDAKFPLNGDDVIENFNVSGKDVKKLLEDAKGFWLLIPKSTKEDLIDILKAGKKASDK